MNYSKFKNYMFKLFRKVDSFLQPIDIERTMSVTWGSMFSVPTTLKEPFFENCFGADFLAQRDIPNISEVCQELRNTTVETLSSSTKLNLNRSRVNRVWKRVAKDLKLDKTTGFNILEANDAAQLLPKNTSSCFPDFITPKSSVLDDNVRRVRNIMASNSILFAFFLVVIRWRSQQRRTGTKFRQFFTFAYPILILESMFFSGIIQYLETAAPTAYCIGSVFPDLARRYSRLQKFKNIYSFDFDSFDTSLSADLIFEGIMFLKRFVKIETEAQNNIFEALLMYHMHCAIATNYKSKAYIFNKSKGLMSGSLITNLLGSVLNLFLFYHFCDEHGIDFDTVEANVMGDDCLFGMNETFTIEYFHNYFMTKFGMSISNRKSEIFKPGDVVFFLGYNFDKHGRYSDFELMKYQLGFSESFIPESVLSEVDRVFSKLCSICFKTKDGYKLFDWVLPKFLKYYNLPRHPEYYSELYTTTGQGIDFTLNKSVSWMRKYGWTIQ